MRKYVVVLALLALACGRAEAQIPPGPFGAQLGNIGSVCPGSTSLCQPLPTYTGPGDLISGWAFWGGLRAFTLATAGTKSANICNSGDANCADVSTLANGNFDVTTAQGAPLNCGGAGGTCTVKTLYDKSGNVRDVTQATVASRPTLTFNCTGSLPCLSYASTQILETASFFTVNQPMTLVAGMNQTSSNGFDVQVMGDVGISDYVGFDSLGTNAKCFGGSNITAAETNGTWYAAQCVANGASSGLTLNGTTTSGSAGTNNMGGQNFVLVNPHFTGKVVEGGIATSAFTVGNLSAINSNIRTYWGF